MKNKCHKKLLRTHLHLLFDHATHQDYLGSKWSRSPYFSARNSTCTGSPHASGTYIGLRCMFYGFTGGSSE